jgi:hypothetical protein
MSKTQHERNSVKFIGIGYNDACVDFQVKFYRHNFSDLEQAIRNVTSYNEFRGAAVAKAFSKIKHLVVSASFGREGSPVLYIELERDNEYFPPETARREVFAAIQTTKPDEANIDSYNDALLRFWWD